MLDIEGGPSAISASARELVGKVEQKALRLSALLREMDNSPVAFDSDLRQELDDALDQLECRIAATRALSRGPREAAN